MRPLGLPEAVAGSAGKQRRRGTCLACRLRARRRAKERTEGSDLLGWLRCAGHLHQANVVDLAHHRPAWRRRARPRTASETAKRCSVKRPGSTTHIVRRMIIRQRQCDASVPQRGTTTSCIGGEPVKVADVVCMHEMRVSFWSTRRRRSVHVFSFCRHEAHLDVVLIPEPGRDPQSSSSVKAAFGHWRRRLSSMMPRQLGC